MPVNRRLAPLYAALLCLVGAASRPAVAADKPLYWVFLDKGTNTTPVSKENNKTMFTAHIGNLERLWKAGLALTAGPLGDDDNIEGIVILTVQKPTEVAECFKPDPYVQNNYMVVESYRWFADRTKFHAPNEPMKMVDYTIGIVKRGPKWNLVTEGKSPTPLKTVLPGMKTWGKAGNLAVSGPLENANKLVGILLFRTADRKMLKEAIDKDPGVVARTVVVELHPQLLAEGVLGK